MTSALAQIKEYHERTKHHFERYARGPGFLDWATQPDPFRHYQGAPRLPLEHPALTGKPCYEDMFYPGRIPVAAVNRTSVSQLLRDALSLSAWKQAGEARWSLRVNPSSGNLHPTEGHLICGAISGLCNAPMVCHYAPKEHALEVRATFDRELWRALVADVPEQTLLVGLSSIPWREAWKYGERAYRYCHHDVGHAIAAVSIAAAGLGWQARLLDALSSDQVGVLLGLHGGPVGDAEAEMADCLLAISPQRAGDTGGDLPDEACAAFQQLPWQGRANRLSRAHTDWPIIDRVCQAAHKPRTDKGGYGIGEESTPGREGPAGKGPSLRQIIHQRRSAVAMDGHTSMTAEAFFDLLRRLLPCETTPPLAVLPWQSCVSLLLFVHRVTGVNPGLYLLVRNSAHLPQLQGQTREDFVWQRPDDCPANIPLYCLLQGDAREAAKQLCCHQAIAGDGCFSLGMLAAFAQPLGAFGPWFYPRLFWECGAIGQLLYLEAEAAGLRATGIGCYFDDGVHRLLGLSATDFQSLYHFTVGGALEDVRLQTLPPYHPVANA